MPQIIKLMGGYEMNAETARAGIRSLIQTEVAIEGPRDEDNTWNLRINRKQVQYILSMSEEQAKLWFAEIRKATPLPKWTRKSHSCPKVEGTAAFQLTAKYQDGVAIDIHPATPNNADLHSISVHTQQSTENCQNQAGCKPNLRECLQVEIEQRIAHFIELPGYSPQTLKNLVDAIASLSDFHAQKNALEQMEQDLRDLHRGKRTDVKQPWGWVVSRLKHLELQVSEQQSPPRLPKQDTVSNSQKINPG